MSFAAAAAADTDWDILIPVWDSSQLYVLIKSFICCTFYNIVKFYYFYF